MPAQRPSSATKARAFRLHLRAGRLCSRWVPDALVWHAAIQRCGLLPAPCLPYRHRQASLGRSAGVHHAIDAVRATRQCYPVRCRAHRILVCSVSKGKPRIGYEGI